MHPQPESRKTDARLVDREALNLAPGLPEQNYEAWADTLGGFGDRQLVDENWRRQVWKFSDWKVDTLRIRETTAGAEEIVRRPHHIRRSFCECVALHIPLQHNSADTLSAIIGDQVMTMHCGDIYIHDLNVPARIVTPSSLVTLSVFVPYNKIGYDPSIHPATMSISSATPAGQMLKNAILSMREGLEQLEVADAPSVAAGLSGLFRGLVVLNAVEETCCKEIASAKKKLTKAYIENHLFESELSTSLLCRQFGMSRATLYRLFAAEGGVAHYLNERRLVHCFRLLRSNPPSRGRVKTVAECLGFMDHSHFNRLFRRKFHMTPSDAMGLWAERPSVSDDPA